MQDYLIKQLLVAVAAFDDVIERRGCVWDASPVRSLIIVEYLWYSLEVMVQPYLPSDKALLHLLWGTTAFNQLLANWGSDAPFLCVCASICCTELTCLKTYSTCLLCVRVCARSRPFLSWLLFPVLPSSQAATCCVLVSFEMCVLL